MRTPSSTVGPRRRAASTTSDGAGVGQRPSAATAASDGPSQAAQKPACVARAAAGQLVAAGANATSAVAGGRPDGRPQYFPGDDYTCDDLVNCTNSSAESVNSSRTTYNSSNSSAEDDTRATSATAIRRQQQADDAVAEMMR